MFLALRELRAARGRFALMGVVIVLVTILQVLLNGLSVGLVDNGIAGLRSLPASHLVLADGSHAVFSRSVMDAADVDDVAAGLGGQGTPLGASFFNARTDGGETIDLALFGIEPAGFLAPVPSQGAPLTTGEATVVVDASLADDGIEVGDRLTIVGPADVTVTVAGIGDTGTYGHVAVAFTPLDVWRAAQYGNAGLTTVSAVAVRDTTTGIPADGGEGAGLEILTLEDAYVGSPGYSAESGTLGLIMGFLLVISALVAGAFFTVWTIQRTRDIGVLKALGASTSYIVRDAVVQAVVLLTLSIGVGVVIGYGLGSLIEAGSAPFRLDPASVLRGATWLGVASLVGATAALRWITSVDPLIALGADR